MRKFLLALCLALFHAVVVVAGIDERQQLSKIRSNDSGVLLLDKTNIYNAINENQPILVMFCKYFHANRLKPLRIAHGTRRRCFMV